MLIDIHVEKIKKEKAKSIPDNDMVKHWLREIETFRDEIKKAEKPFQRG